MACSNLMQLWPSIIQRMGLGGKSSHILKHKVNQGSTEQRQSELELIRNVREDMKTGSMPRDAPEGIQSALSLSCQCPITWHLA